MGYRVYIGHLPKRRYNKIKQMSYDELTSYYETNNIVKVDSDFTEDSDGNEVEYKHLGVYDLGNTLYEFGKYVSYYDKKTCKPFFKNKDTQSYYNEDNECYIVTKEFLANVIEEYAKKIQKFYADMMEPFLKPNLEYCRFDSEFLKSVKRDYNVDTDTDTYSFDFSKIKPEEESAIFLMIEHIRSMYNEWKGNWRPYYLDNNNDVITSSWKYEYGIFELIKIYKTFDWKRNVMYYYGY